MSEKLMAVLAFAIFTGFLVILVWYVPRWDLGGVVAATLALAGIDTMLILRRHGGTDK
ncbi:hypothetical protein [Paracoccus saliphilus]|uniref:Uncharacterized protein n=1 Tax=Paracoccus saliphilus TaxID=405559 RepID=A0AA46A3Y3_9RHOB|nr:hypothetical protein [Paracoccus saliphilus]WCR03380.1 hypothetical protein JHX88_00940 [Paracoccus saliphilus]SIS52573.1 hypothetical protein SAMN05421772_101259 [Paracoccus saliphilus]